MSGRCLAVGWANVIHENILKCKDGRWLTGGLNNRLIYPTVSTQTVANDDKNNNFIDDTLDNIAGDGDITLTKIDKEKAKEGGYSTQVKIVKQNLLELGTLTEEQANEEGFTDETEAALELFQRSYKLQEDDPIQHDEIEFNRSEFKVTKQIDRATLLMMDEALINGWKYKKLPIVKNAEWYYKDKEELKPIVCLPFGANEIYVRIELSYNCYGKRIEIRYKERNTLLSDTLIKEKTYNIDNNEWTQLCPVSFSIDDYARHDEDDVGHYIFEIKIDGEEYKPQRALNVHAVIYIPEIMESLGYTQAAKVQRKWFNREANAYSWNAEPELDAFPIEWALGFERVKNKLDKYKYQGNAWQSEAAKNQLKKEILRMIENKDATQPSSENPVVKFGTFDKQIVQECRSHDEADNKHASEYMPLFEKYYFKSVVYDHEYYGYTTPLDDFMASIGKFSMHFCAIGTLQYIDDKNVKVVITKIGYYIKDSYDFVNFRIFQGLDFSEIPQWLGFWSLKDKQVSKFETEITSLNEKYRLINNDSYNNYREDAKKGGAFYQYSTIGFIENPNLEFELELIP